LTIGAYLQQKASRWIKSIIHTVVFSLLISSTNVLALAPWREAGDMSKMAEYREESGRLESDCRDGFIQSRGGQASLDLQRIREEEREKLTPVELENFAEIRDYIQERISAFEEQIAEMAADKREWPEKRLQVAREGLERLQRIYESGGFYSFAGFIYHTEDYALAYGSEGEIGIAEELLSLPLPLLAELLFHEAVCFKEKHWEAKMIQQGIFRENYLDAQGRKINKLGQVIRELIDNTARQQDGVDPFALFADILGSPAGIQPVFIDEGQYGSDNLKKTLEKALPGAETLLFAGSLDFISLYRQCVSLPQDGEWMKSLIPKIKVLVTKENGIVGVSGVSAETNEKIKAMLTTNEPQLVELWSLFCVLQLADSGYEGLEDMLDNFFQQREPLFSFAELRGMIRVLQRHKQEYEQWEEDNEHRVSHRSVSKQTTEEREERQHYENERYTIREQLEDEERSLKALLELLPEELLTSYIKKLILTAEMKSRDLLRILENLIKDEDGYHDGERLLDLLWRIYLQSENTSSENECLREFLLLACSDIYKGVKSAFRSISDVFTQGNLNQVYLAMDVLLRLPADKDKLDHLFSLLGSVRYKKEVLAAYCLLNITLFGIKDEYLSTSASTFVSSLPNPLFELLNSESRFIYYYLRKMQEARKRGGSLKYDADRRIYAMTKALDGDAFAPGQKGDTWFSSLRRRVHNYSSARDLRLISGVLYYWKELQEEIIADPDNGLLSAVKESIGEDTSQRYSNLLNRALAQLQAQGKISSLVGDDFLSEITDVAEDEVLAVVEQVSKDILEEELAKAEKEWEKRNIRFQQQDDLEKIQQMIILFYALTERYGVIGAAIVPKIRGEVGAEYAGERAWNIKKMRIITGFMSEDYQALLSAIEGNDQRELLRCISQCRLQLRNHLLFDKIEQMEHIQEEEIKDTLLELDFNLYLLGKELLVELLGEINRCETMADLREEIGTLVSMGKFILASGLGGVEFEQFVYELEHGRLKYSQLHDLVRALGTEVHKISRQLNEQMRFASRHIWDNLEFYKLSEEWQERLDTELVKNKYGHDEPVVTPKGRIEAEQGIIDGLLTDIRILVFDDVLAKFNEILEVELAAENDELVSEQKPEDSFVLADQFFRFGQPEVELGSPRQRLLSRWSKKGLNLVKMTEEEVAVPPGVVISAELVTDPEIFHSPPFQEQVEAEIEEIRKHSLYPDLKFLLYVRSGSAFSLPGLLTTIPNMGMNDEEARKLAEQTGDEWFAYDTYAEFIRAFAIYILGIPEEYFQEAFNVYDKDSLSGEEMKQVVERYKRVVQEHGHGRQIPEQMIDQVMMAIDAVYASWDSAEAQEYRLRHRISPEWGTVVILQKGVFGNLTEKDGRISGSGHAALRVLPDGREVVQGRFRIRGMGHDLMSRSLNYIYLSNTERDPDAEVKERTLEDEYPETYQALLEQGHRLKEIFGNNQKFEFTIELGKVWVTQCSDDFIKDDYPEFMDLVENTVIGRGRGVSGGAFRGWVANSVSQAEELLARFEIEKPADVDGVILFLDRVNPEMINMLPPDVAICAKNISVHAETLAQKYGISAVYGIVQMKYEQEEDNWYVGEQKMTTGMIISIDGHENQLVYHNSGRIFLGSVSLAAEEDEKTEVERRSPRALDRIRELKEREQREAALRKERLVLTRFDREIIAQFEKFIAGDIKWGLLTRYRIRYQLLMDKFARFCEPLDFELYGEGFSWQLTERLALWNISLELFLQLDKHFQPRGAGHKEILRNVLYRLNYQPPVQTRPDTITVYDGAGEEETLVIADLLGDRFQGRKYFILNPLPPGIKLVSFDLDCLLYEGMRTIEEVVEIFGRVKALGYQTALTTTNPDITRWSYLHKQLRGVVDYIHYAPRTIDLTHYVAELGLKPNEIIHFGEFDLSRFFSAGESLHEQGFLTAYVRTRILTLPFEEIIAKQIDAVISGRFTVEDILTILQSADECGKLEVSEERPAEESL